MKRKQIIIIYFIYYLKEGVKIIIINYIGSKNI